VIPKFLELAEDALEILKKASKGQRASSTDILEPGIRKGKDWETLEDKASMAISLLNDLYARQNYTICTELAFYSMERATEAAVIKNFISVKKSEHGLFFQEAAELGILEKDLADSLYRLFRYRSEIYYRGGIGTQELSEKMIALSNGLWDILHETKDKNKS
jgi:uncharacterized protein (UPF0332 family)